MGFWVAAAPALVKAGATILGSIFGRKSDKKDRAYEEARQMTQFARLRKAAIKGGFNPLTVLRATGGAGFGPAGQVRSVADGVMASADFLGDALGAGLNWKTDLAARNLALEGQALQNDLARSALSQAAGFGSGWTVPTYEEKGPNVRYGGPQLAGGGARGVWPELAGAFSSTFTGATQGVGALISDALGMADRNASLATGENLDASERRGQDAMIDFGRFLYDDVLLGGFSRVQDWRDFTRRATRAVAGPGDWRADLSGKFQSAVTGPAAAYRGPRGGTAPRYEWPELSLPSIKVPKAADYGGFSLGRVASAWSEWRKSKGY